ncbi:FAD binding domain-containing protein [Leptodontidium sp. MPI-SDFR-AT-0119]|nr:FAD binding domain-containing protein [Leptodontidium sp. MPI-SDFR-AT-0119]
MSSKTLNSTSLKTFQLKTVMEIDTDVLVVGAGVAGLALSILLRDLGVRILTISKHRGTATAPRAHITNQRTMEIFRDMGIEEQVKDLSTPLKDVGNFVLTTNMTDRKQEIARYSCYGAGVDQLTSFTKASPCEMMNIPQHILEQVLLKRASGEGSDIRFYNELLRIEETMGKVSARVRDRHTQAEYLVRARYVVGADGANSLVAKQLGIPFLGESKVMSMVSSWLEVDLTEYTAYRPAAIYFLLAPGNAYWVGSGTCVIVKPFTEWILTKQYEPEDGEPDTSDEGVIVHARKVLNLPSDFPIHVKNSSKWQVNNIVATTYRKGPVFLVGDAAHRHPPTTGLGSNTCVQDAYNLAWKLALVVSGQATEQLLESYNRERQPVGQVVVSHAMQTLHNMVKVPQTLGFQRGQSVEEGYASLEELFYADTLQGEKRREQLEEVVRLQHRRSNALGLQLGHRYNSTDPNSCAVVDDGTPFPEHKLDPVLFYEPTTHPGAYLPHAYVEYENRRISTLDIIPHGKFGLFVGVSGKVWHDAMLELSHEVGVEVSVHTIGHRCDYNDVLGEWTNLREVRDTGAILIRPDCHIAWRCIRRPDNPTEALRVAFNRILGNSSKESAPKPLVGDALKSIL